MGSVYINNIQSPKWTCSKQFELEDEYVHVYKINMSDELSHLAYFSKLLSPNEQLSANRYFRKQDRDRFTISKGAMREILHRYTGVAPEYLIFGQTSEKKPFVYSLARVFFNISHSSDWITIAISNLEVGVDVEFISPGFSFAEIIQEHFSRAEAFYVNAEVPDLAFYKLWTRKEAFLKATGQGIGDHLKVTPSLDGIHLLDAELSGSDKNWHMSSFMVTQDYVCTVAAELACISFMEDPFVGL